VTWIVADMDDGVLRRAPTRRAGVTWALAHFGGLLLERHGYSGCWEYLFGFPDEGGDSVFIVSTSTGEDDNVADVETVRTAS